MGRQEPNLTCVKITIEDSYGEATANNAIVKKSGGYNAVGSCSVEGDGNYDVYSIVSNKYYSNYNTYGYARRIYCDPNNMAIQGQFDFTYNTIEKITVCTVGQIQTETQNITIAMKMFG